MAEQGLVLVKPDGVKRGLVNEVMGRIQEPGLRLVGLKMVSLTRRQAEEIYAEHRGKEFFGPLVDFMTSGPIAASVWEGEDAVKLTREVVGATSPNDARPGTIRRDFGTDTRHNVVHASATARDAQREVNVLFDCGELFGSAKTPEGGVAVVLARSGNGMRVAIAAPSDYVTSRDCILYILPDRASACRKRNEVCEELGFPPFDRRYDREDGLPDLEALEEARRTLALPYPAGAGFHN